MNRTRSGIAISVLGALIISTSCETAGPKKASTAPPVRAQAPTMVTPAAPPQQPRKVEETLKPRQDPIDAQVAQSEATYQHGIANYNAGHLEAAKEDFDKSFDILLSGQKDVRDDERLEKQFDRVVEAVHNLELVALKQGDGFTEQRSEPAPIDEANDVTFPVDPNVRAKAEQDIKQIHSDLPLVLNDQVASFISYFSSKGRGTLERALVRSGRYRDMISRVLREEGVPQDLIYLAQAESGFQPLALSRAGARGMWQFMASRANGYGLERNWWVDDRQDPEKATRAAARHLKDLYTQFGDWYLAMAAYNSGPGTVQHAVQRTGYADFWELYRRNVLPGETRNYVPIIIAVTIMAKNPAQYGLDHLVLEPPAETDKVTVNYPVDLRLVAECADTSVATLQELNPSLLRMTTPKDQPFELRLPAGSAAKFQQAIAAIPQDMRTYWRYHRVQPGESLGMIAQKYRTTTKAIAEVNNLEPDQELLKDAKLVIPVAPGRSIDSATAFSKRPVYYKVRKGDTVLSVADDYGVPVERLRRWNHLSGNQLRAGMTLRIYKPLAASSGREVASKTRPKGRVVVDDDDDPPVSGRGSMRTASARGPAKPQAAKSFGPSAAAQKHKVKRGETLYSIAAEYNTTVENLKRDNKKLANNIKAGDILVIRK